MKLRLDSFDDRKSGGNPNAKVVDIGPITIWFSYHTPIAFADDQGMVVRANDFSNTTGKHLNSLGRDRQRVSGEEFKRLLEERIGKYFKPRQDLNPDTPAGIVADWLDDHGQYVAAEAVRAARPAV